MFHEGARNDELIAMFHPSQLERKFGGKADNLDVFWPPQEVSTEYGVDSSKIKRPAKPIYDSSADVDMDDEDLSIINLERGSSNILTDTIRFNNKLSP